MGSHYLSIALSREPALSQAGREISRGAPLHCTRESLARLVKTPRFGMTPMRTNSGQPHSHRGVFPHSRVTFKFLPETASFGVSMPEIKIPRGAVFVTKKKGILRLRELIRARCAQDDRVCVAFFRNGIAKQKIART